MVESDSLIHVEHALRYDWREGNLLEGRDIACLQLGVPNEGAEVAHEAWCGLAHLSSHSEDTALIPVL